MCANSTAWPWARLRPGAAEKCGVCSCRITFFAKGSSWGTCVTGNMSERQNHEGTKQATNVHNQTKQSSNKCFENSLGTKHDCTRRFSVIKTW